jgi:ATP-dependent Clp protease ATP-binding subunit ClpA
VHVSLKEDKLAFELTPAPPKASKRKPKKVAATHKQPVPPVEESNGEGED